MSPRLPAVIAVTFALLAGLASAPASGGPALTPQLPDLIAYEDHMRRHYVSREGNRVLLRFATTLVNVGDGPLEVRGRRSTARGPLEAFQCIYSGIRKVRDQRIGTFVHHMEHRHWHLMEVAEYRLLDQNGHLLNAGKKVSFCMIDTGQFYPDLPRSPRTKRYRTCATGANIRRLKSGISVGWGDTYGSYLPDQWVDITGLRPGNYFLQIEVDPMGIISEKSESNNVATVPVVLK